MFRLVGSLFIGYIRITRWAVYSLYGDGRLSRILFKERLFMSDLQKPFISVGIDVGADVSYMSIALPSQLLVGKPLRITHSNLTSLEACVSKIKEAEEMYSLESRIFLESTGVYHYPLFCFLRDRGFNCYVINPIITKNSTNINIRKVHNDKFDSKKLALVGLKPDLKVSVMPADIVLDLQFSGSTELYGLRFMRTYRNSMVSEAAAADFLRKNFFYFMRCQLKLGIKEIISAKQCANLNTARFHEIA